MFWNINFLEKLRYKNVMKKKINLNEFYEYTTKNPTILLKLLWPEVEKSS
jgi:hypothetical protein